MNEYQEYIKHMTSQELYEERQSLIKESLALQDYIHSLKQKARELEEELSWMQRDKAA